MNRRCTLLIVGAVYLPVAVGPLEAHPGPHERLLLYTEELRQSPTDGALYLNRGVLLREMGRWDEALADLERAAEYAPELELLDLAWGQLFHQAGWPGAAEPYLRRFLSQHPENTGAMVTLARALSQLERHAEAADLYDRAIRLAHYAKPDLYLECSRALVAAGRPKPALRALDQGIERLGSITALHQAALEVELLARDYDAALRRVEPLAKSSPRREEWLLKQGEILENVGRFHEAQAVLDTAWAALQSRPAHRRRAGILRDLELGILEARGRLATTSRNETTRTQQALPR